MSELPLETYYDLTQVGEVAVSPDGDRVAFTATEYDPDEDEPVASLFVAPADGSREPHRLTRLPGAGSPKWGPEGDRLAFLAGREEDTERRVGRDDEDEENGGDDPKSQVWLFDLALGGDATQLTEFDEGVREFDWSPEADRLVVSARDPDEAEEAYLEGRREEGAPIETERLQHKLDGVGYTDTVTTYLFVVSVGEEGEPDRLDDAYGGGAMEGLRGLQPAWGAGDRIAFLSTRTDEPDDTMVADVYTIDPDGSGLKRLTDGDLGCGAPTWSPSGDRLAFAAGDPENWCKPSEVYVHDGEGYESLTPDLDRTVARGGAPRWTDEETLHVAIADDSRTRLLRIDGVGGSGSGDGESDDPERVFEAQGDDRALAGFHADPESDRAAIVLSDPADGQDVYSVGVGDLDADEEPDSLTRLSNANEELIGEYEMPEAERVEWESDGWTIDGVLYTPPEFDAADGPAPLVVAIHGGPISYDEPMFSFAHAALTSRGYAVLRPNYRGGSSRGRKFAETLRGRWGTVEVEDIAAGVEFAVEEGIADPDRVFGYGFSYGGIAQGFLVTQRPDLFTAAAPEHGIYDLRSSYGTDDSHNWMENEYGLPWEESDKFDASSAILDAGEIETPLLITAGQEDWRCPPSQSEQLYVAAKKSAGEARLVLYPDEHHNVGTPERAIHRLEEVLAWYRRHDPAVEEESEDIHGRLEDGKDENGDDSDEDD
ncbi:S9 family peptidase [Saliphagus sp. LR7]|uniref:S9 family peptidase n=1 Tax=Saliphagus sp. LR7 TaxID=2282654 RepID=UPI000DF75923|nr:S9 family peptidase [Saliphagus sp. LR7]